MKISLLRYAAAILFVLFVFSGCGNDSDSKNADNNQYPDGYIETFIWETTGGGDILFSITQVSEGFEISIERFNFQPADLIVTLTPAMNLDVHDFVEDIFNKTINIYDYVIIPIGETGSWTTITLIFSEDQEREIENIGASDDDLKMLYDFVVFQLGPI